MQIAFSLIVFRHDDIAVLLCQVARQFRRHIDIVVDGEGFVRASIPVLRPQACNGRNRIAHLFHPYVDTVDDSLRLFVITGFRLDHDTDGDFALAPMRNRNVSVTVVNLQDVVFTDIEAFVDFLFLVLSCLAPNRIRCKTKPGASTDRPVKSRIVPSWCVDKLFSCVDKLFYVLINVFIVYYSC